MNTTTTHTTEQATEQTQQEPLAAPTHQAPTLLAPTLASIMNIRVRPLPLAKGWRDFMGNLPAESGWSIQVTGAPGQGKSTFAMKFADELQRHGNVLYAFAEEVHLAGTIQERARMSGMRSMNIAVPEIFTKAELKRHLDTGKYKFCIVDSINTFDDADDAEMTHLSKEYPLIGFFFVAQTLKTRKGARGSGANEHNVYATMMSELRGKERWMVHVKNRYGAKVSEMYVFTGA